MSDATAVPLDVQEDKRQEPTPLTRRGRGIAPATAWLPGQKAKARCWCCRRPVPVVKGEPMFSCECSTYEDRELCVRCGRCPEDCCKNGYGTVVARKLREER